MSVCAGVRVCVCVCWIVRTGATREVAHGLDFGVEQLDDSDSETTKLRIRLFTHHDLT